MYYNYLPYTGNCGLSSFIPQYQLPCCQPSSTIVNINIPPCPGAEPEPLNLDSLTVGVDKNGEMRDASSGELTGLKLQDCIDIISLAKHTLKIGEGSKLEGECEEDKCQKCVDAINSSVVDLKKGDGGKEDGGKEEVSQGTLYFTDAQMPLEDNISIIF
ncbi:MAG: hypothetical protein ACR5LA_06820 [Wolbachia sp.]